MALTHSLRKTFGVDVAVFEIAGGSSFIAVGTTIATQMRGEVAK
jgi:hypothetical protein